MCFPCFFEGSFSIEPFPNIFEILASFSAASGVQRPTPALFWLFLFAMPVVPRPCALAKPTHHPAWCPSMCFLLLFSMGSSPNSFKIRVFFCCPTAYLCSLLSPLVYCVPNLGPPGSLDVQCATPRSCVLKGKSKACEKCARWCFKGV